VLQSSLIACNRIKSCSEGKVDQKEHDQLRFSNRDDRGRNRDSVNVVLGVTGVSRWQFLTDFDEIWYRRLEPDAKEPFRWGQNPIKVSPILPDFTLN